MPKHTLVEVYSVGNNIQTLHEKQFTATLA